MAERESAWQAKTRALGRSTQMRKLTPLVTLLALAGFLAGAVIAATISGTAKGDLLRGTSRADTISGGAGNDKLYGNGGNDKLYGGDGNDRLYGGPGNDYLVGGAGSDVFSCGAGKDTVIRDSKDKIGRDCETVKSATTSKPGPYAKPGHYSGTTSQLEKVEFTVSPDGRRVTGGTWWYNLSCDPPDRVSPHENYYVVDPLQLKANGSWSATEDDIDKSPEKKITLVSSLKITKSGSASGTFKVTSSFTQDQTVFTCWSNEQTWTAKLDA